MMAMAASFLMFGAPAAGCNCGLDNWLPYCLSKGRRRRRAGRGLFIKYQLHNFPLRKLFLALKHAAIGSLANL